MGKRRSCAFAHGIVKGKTRCERTRTTRRSDPQRHADRRDNIHRRSHRVVMSAHSSRLRHKIDVRSLATRMAMQLYAPRHRPPSPTASARYVFLHRCMRTILNCKFAFVCTWRVCPLDQRLMYHAACDVQISVRGKKKKKRRVWSSDLP